MLKVDKISKSFEKKPVLDNISLTLENTGITAIMGVSGIGKTTLLNIIAGLEKADSGTISSSFSKISYKFQEPRLFPWLTALENVKLVIEDKHSADSIARRLLERVGLCDSLNKYPDELSGGMQQRVSLVRALAHGGDLLLLDEPFSAVDQETREILLQLISEFAENRSVVLVTHSQEEAEILGANIITLQ